MRRRYSASVHDGAAGGSGARHAIHTAGRATDITGQSRNSSMTGTGTSGFIVGSSSDSVPASA